MPWVAACFDLLAAPLLGYCLALRKLALQAGILQERKIDLAGSPTTTNAATPLHVDDTINMVPNAEEQRQGKVRASARARCGIISLSCVRGMLTLAYVIRPCSPLLLSFFSFFPLFRHHFLQVYFSTLSRAVYPSTIKKSCYEIISDEEIYAYMSVCVTRRVNISTF
jgi:hypothetical protein